MTDPLDDLKSRLNAATPTPDPAAKAQALARASDNFATLQGSSAQVRPTSRHSFWTRIKTMWITLTSPAGLTATTALVACGFLLVTPIGQNMRPSAGAPASALSAPTPVPTTGAPPIPTSDEVFAETASTPPLDQANRTAAAPQLSTDMADVTLTTRQALPTAPALAPEPPATALAPNTETFANADPNPLRITTQTPVSTFSIDVDTASYALVRQSLNAGHLPPPDAVRIEEMINYFPYTYPTDDSPHPFTPTVSVFETPWNPDTQLVHIALQGDRPSIAERPPLNLVFLIDTSGSMEAANKLPLLRQSFRLMLSELRPEDEVAIVSYAGSSTIALPPTPASDRPRIEAALDALTAGGATHGESGLKQAYALAKDMTEEGDVSRVILATDGDFNLGLSDPSALETYIAQQRDDGTYLNVLGFGRGNLHDTTLQTLAQNGNGMAAYIDTLAEAQKALVDGLTGALFPLANDVKIQVEFNPATVAEYRLIGYETRALRREDFNNDAVDAGELGAGHSVTAIYEITPVGSPAQLNDPLRYQAADTTALTGPASELGFLRLRYKQPGSLESQLIETPFGTVAPPSEDAAFAAAIAGFGQLLRDPAFLADWSYEDAIALATDNRGDDRFGYRTQAVQLMRLAQSLSN